jgi:hypothetical protein
MNVLLQTLSTVARKIASKLYLYFVHVAREMLNQAHISNLYREPRDLVSLTRKACNTTQPFDAIGYPHQFVVINAKNSELAKPRNGFGNLLNEMNVILNYRYKTNNFIEDKSFTLLT